MNRKKYKKRSALNSSKKKSGNVNEKISELVQIFESQMKLEALSIKIDDLRQHQISSESTFDIS